MKSASPPKEKNLSDTLLFQQTTPIVDENRYSLEQVGDAHALLESGKAVGKVVIEN